MLAVATADNCHMSFVCDNTFHHQQQQQQRLGKSALLIINLGAQLSGRSWTDQVLHCVQRANYMTKLSFHFLANGTGAPRWVKYTPVAVVVAVWRR